MLSRQFCPKSRSDDNFQNHTPVKTEQRSKIIGKLAVQKAVILEATRKATLNKRCFVCLHNRVVY